MKKILFIILTLLFAGFFIHNKLTTKQALDTNKKQVAIAIFVPSSHPALEDIEQGFKETLNQLGTSQYRFTTYNANGNKTLLRAQAEEIAQDNYNLTFTVGVSCTQILAEVLKKKGKSTPLIFVAVDDPVGMGIINSLESSGNNLTGIIENPSYDKQLEVLLKAKPSTKHVLLAYDPAHGTGLEKDKQAIEVILKKHGVKLNSIEIFQSSEIQQKVTSLLPGKDVVLALKDHTIVAGIDSLITLCNRYGVTLFASDLNSGEKGAALAYGVTEYDFGLHAAKKALLILADHKHPSDIPVTPITNYKVMVNSKTMSAQNLVLTPEIKQELNIIEVK